MKITIKHMRKDVYKKISFINTDVNILRKMLVNQIQ